MTNECAPDSIISLDSWHTLLMKKEVRKSTIQLLKIAVITALIYFAFRYLLKLVYPFLIAYGIAVLLNPLLEKIHKKWQIKRGILSALLVLFTFLIVGGVLGGAGYALVVQAKKFAQNYDTFAYKGAQVWEVCCDRVEDICGLQAGRVERYASSYLPKVWEKCQTMVVPKIMNYSIGYAKGLLVGFSILVVVAVSTILILADYPNIRQKITDNPIGNLTYRIGRNMKSAGGTYLKAQFLILLVISAICCVGLLLTGNSYAVLAGCCIGLCDALPFFGTGTVFIPWLLIKVFYGQYMLAAAYGVIYLICNFTREFLEPKLIGSRLSIHPMMVLISTYIGLCIFGVFGFFLGPVAGLLIAEIYKVTEEE